MSIFQILDLKEQPFNEFISSTNAELKITIYSRVLKRKEVLRDLCYLNFYRYVSKSNIINFLILS